jgi:hypothetical protein
MIDLLIGERKSNYFFPPLLGFLTALPAAAIISLLAAAAV